MLLRGDADAVPRRAQRLLQAADRVEQQLTARIRLGDPPVIGKLEYDLDAFGGAEGMHAVVSQIGAVDGDDAAQSQRANHADGELEVMETERCRLRHENDQVGAAH